LLYVIQQKIVEFSLHIFTYHISSWQSRQRQSLMVSRILEVNSVLMQLIKQEDFSQYMCVYVYMYMCVCSRVWVCASVCTHVCFNQFVFLITSVSDDGNRGSGYIIGVYFMLMQLITWEDFTDGTEEFKCLNISGMSYFRLDVQQALNQELYRSSAQRADGSVIENFRFTSSGMGIVPVEILNLRHNFRNWSRILGDIYFEGVSLL